ncbi:ATP synthase subunit delta, mitochondrial [Trichinella spiralis]|uniref:ATP synthase subunit delta, mitochondrial n=1 Tax=Trichinella spiralis TaxID=6334 RepID=A0A0V1BDA8_TRISP|nr:ATP synthase subunit delta, mitochondrial [Trichinella spiralis]
MDNFLIFVSLILCLVLCFRDKSSTLAMFLRHIFRLTACSRTFSVRQFAQEAADISLTFACPSQVFYNQSNVQQVSVPTIDGEVGIYPNHVPLIGVLKPGVMRVYEQDMIRKFFGTNISEISSGTVSINEDSSVQVIAEEACDVSDLDLQACESGLEKMKSQSHGGATDEKAAAENAIAVEVYEALVQACHEA